MGILERRHSHHSVQHGSDLHRFEKCHDVLEKLDANVNTLIIIPNEKLLRSLRNQAFVEPRDLKVAERNLN